MASPKKVKSNEASVLRRAGVLLVAFLFVTLLGWWFTAGQTSSEEVTPIVAQSPRQQERRSPASPGPAQPSSNTPPTPPTPSENAVALPPLTGIELYDNSAKPFRIGVVVPDDFVLPEGYVRHYQMNEDGTPLKPILMYHPDFHPKDSSGAPLPIPGDLIVPGDQLPKGLAAVMLEVPRVHFDGGVL